MHTKHVAYYVRVSSRQQDTASQLPDMQRHATIQTDPVVWYTDKATGKKMDRPQWNKLAAAIATGQVSKVVVWRLDRLGRTASGLTRLFDELRAGSVGLVSLRDGLDLDTPAGRLMANVLASVAQYETEIRSERVQAGQAVARANGKRWGGSEAGRTMKGKATEEQIGVIARMKSEGAKIAAIARATGLSRPTVYAYLPA